MERAARILRSDRPQGGPQPRERNLKSLGAAPPSFAKVHNFAGTLAAAKLTGKLCKGHAAGGGCGILRSAGWRERKPMKLKLVVLALAIVCASQAAADSFNAFYSFGDSSVDSGWGSDALQREFGGGRAPSGTGNAKNGTQKANSLANGDTASPDGDVLSTTQIPAEGSCWNASPAH